MLSANPYATPVRRSGYIDKTKASGRRMVWQFWYADGTSNFTYDPKMGLKMTERIMKAGLIKPEFGDAIRAAAIRKVLDAQPG